MKMMPSSTSVHQTNQDAKKNEKKVEPKVEKKPEVK